MQTITTWPELAQIALPQNVKTALIKHLTEPFENESAAKSYWQSSGTKLVVSAPPENIEYTQSLPEGYTISLVITSDAGEGIYYLTPPIQE